MSTPPSAPDAVDGRSAAGEAAGEVTCGEASLVARDVRGLRMPVAVLASSGVAAAAAAGLGSEGLAVAAGCAALAGLVLAALRFTQAPMRKGPATPVTLDEEVLRVARLPIARAKLVQGLVQPAEGGALLQLRTSRWREPIVLHFDEAERAHELLARLGLDAEGRTAHFVAQSAWLGKRWFVPGVVLGSLALVAVMVMGVAAGWPGPLVLALVACWAASTLGAAVPVFCSVGLDGLRIRGLGRAEFIPWADIVRVTPHRTKSVVMEAGGIEIEVRGRAAPLRLPMATDRMAADTPERLAARIEQARAAASSRAAPLALPGSPSEKVTAAKAVLAGATSYRGPYVAPEAVTALVLDPRAEPSDRVAAAVALAGSEEGRAHVRIAARTTAEPSVQMALEEALAEAEQVEEPARRRLR